MPSIDRTAFIQAAEHARQTHSEGIVVVPVAIRVLADQLTPVLAYRRLVSRDQRTAPSMLLESVENGNQQGRHSILGAHPVIEFSARQNTVRVIDHEHATDNSHDSTDPLGDLRALSAAWHLEVPQRSRDLGLLPDCVLGGWFGYSAYDSVRYAEPRKLGFAHAPRDDRDLPEVSFGFYDELVVFDHVEKLVHLVKLVRIAPTDDPGERYDTALESLDALAKQV